jgi:dihydrofolate reductase
MTISAIVAVSTNGTIGRNGDLPWHLPADLRFFKHTTMGCPVIMGRRNWESIPPKYRPLSGRTNLVVSRNIEYRAPGASVHSSLEHALAHAQGTGAKECFVIGGGQIYQEAFRKNLIARLYLTRVHAHIEGDVTFSMPRAETWHSEVLHEHPKDEDHAHAFTVIRYDKIT